MRALLLVLLASAAYAADKQAASCKSNADCKAPLTCVHTPKPRCAQVCDDKTKCPEDQRCVKDHGNRVCRPITDGVDL